jgi:hypothetical protein
MKLTTKRRSSIAGTAALAAAIAGSCIMMPMWSASAEPVFARLTNVPYRQQQRATPLQSLPFTFDQVVASLSKTFDLQLIEKYEGKYAAFRLLDTNTAESSRELMQVTASTKGTHLLVTFSMRESIGMHYLAEFLESPLFTPWESEHLYEVMQRERHADVPVNLGRFVISVAKSRSDTWQTIAFDFAPVAAL